MLADRSQGRRRLDSHLAAAGAMPTRPHRGWIRAIREALGMSTAEMGDRMDVSQQRVSALERNEVHETIKLDTLRRAAAALNCELVYAFVPRTSLDDAVRTQAQKKAEALLGPVAHHSRLEDQSLSGAETDAQLDGLAARLIDKRGLWSQT